ncbi:hypothetical protein BGK49_21505 [Shigella sp. FC1544]|nr:hypothetical protein BGK49_21505 [Shigella sp. FC1544]
MTTTELFWDLNAIKWLVEGRGDDVSPFENIPVPDITWICPYISRHLLSLNPLQARCRRYSRGER